MKNTIILLVTFLFGTSALDAQIRLESLENSIGVENNTYYKDLYNVLSGFEGTYEYTGTDFYFKIILLKRTMKVRSSGNSWRDTLEGTYQYTKNGVDANYLNDPFDDTVARIEANGIRKADDGLPYFCPDCLSEKWLRGRISDYANDRVADLYIAKRIVNGQEGLELGFRYTIEGHVEGDPLPLAPHLPEGTFFVRKIN